MHVCVCLRAFVCVFSVQGLAGQVEAPVDSGLVRPDKALTTAVSQTVMASDLGVVCVSVCMRSCVYVCVMVTDLKAGVWKAGSTERLLRQESRRQGVLKGFLFRSLEGTE